MNAADMILLVLLVCVLTGAVRRCIRLRKKGGCNCGCCGGSCEKCGRM